MGGFVRKTPGGRWRGVVKAGRVQVASRTFNRKRDAQSWVRREEARLDGGYDPTAGNVRLRDLIDPWLVERRRTVAAKTAATDAELLRLVGEAPLGKIFVGDVEPRHLARWYQWLLSQRPDNGRGANGLSHSSVQRYRASLSSLMAWAVVERYIQSNPVLEAKAPRSQEPVKEMRPLTEAGLVALVSSIAEAGKPTWADVIEVAGWLGPRWGELRAFVVADLELEHAIPGIRVQRSQSEGGEVKATKSYETRRVPIPDHLMPALQRFADGKRPQDLLITGPEGGQLWRTDLIRGSNFRAASGGRRLHDLRHTAACIWLARGVLPGSVQSWLGHESIATTNRYLHYLGTDADALGLAALNRSRPGLQHA